MKKLLITALLLLPFLGITQTTTHPTEGPLGIRFGSNQEEVTTAVGRKGGNIDKKNSGIHSLFFDNVKFNNRLSTGFLVYFVNNKAYAVLFVFTPNKEAETIDYYKSLVSDVSQAYGIGKATIEFKKPFIFGDGHELTALWQNQGFMFTDWSFGKNSIQAAISNKTDKLTVTLYYENADLKAEHDAKGRQK